MSEVYFELASISKNRGFTLYIFVHRLSDKSGQLKIVFLVLNQNICCGYSKEPPRRDGSLSTHNTCLN